MTEKNDLAHNFAGIFFADDNVIWATAHAKLDGPPYPGMTFSLNRDFVRNPALEAERFPVMATAKEDIDRAVLSIRNSMSKSEFSGIKAVTTASHGPFEDGISTYKSGGRVIKGARTEKWSGCELHALVTQAFKNHGNVDIQVRCLTDVEAMVAGEHYFYRQAELRKAKQGSPQYDARLNDLGRDTVAYLSIDEGVGAAIFRQNAFIRGEASVEMGHMTICPVPDEELSKDYPILSCGKHFLPCLEGTISLSALEEWKFNEHARKTLDMGNQCFEVFAYFIAQAVYQIVLFHSPTVILLGGRGMNLGSDDRISVMVQLVKKHYRSISANRDYIESGDFQFQDGADWPAQTKKEHLFPNYKKQYDELEFIKRWTQHDAGVLGCLVWGYRAATMGEQV